MAKELLNQNLSLFEQIRQTDENGNEFWMARNLSKVLDYSEGRHFIPVIERAKEAFVNSGLQFTYLYEDILVKITTGNQYNEKLKACYLFVQNVCHAK